MPHDEPLKPELTADIPLRWNAALACYQGDHIDVYCPSDLVHGEYVIVRLSDRRKFTASGQGPAMLLAGMVHVSALN